MGNRLTRIYTRTGDNGDTGLGDGSRQGKDTPRLQAIGDVDELNSVLAMVLAADPPEVVAARLVEIQHDLFTLGGELSLPGQQLIRAECVARLEWVLDDFNRDLPPLRDFILPGGGQGAAVCHLARAVCRRAERSTVALSRVEVVGEPLRAYLNRLSDLLFVIARVLAREAGGVEMYWRGKNDES